MARGRAANSRSQSPPQQYRRAPQAPPAAHTPAPAQYRSAPPMVQQSQPSMLGSIGSAVATGMSFGAGSAVGHMAINSLFGGGSSSHHQPPAPVEQQAQPAYQTHQPSNNNPCMQYDREFFQCMEKNNSDLSICKLPYEELSMCKRQYGQ